METYTLSNGVAIPKIAFGTWQIPEGDPAYQSVRHALQVGYTHVDTAQIYGNEVSVGRAIADSGLAREEIFLTTKVWNDKHDYDLAKSSIEESLTKLGVDYIDLLLIHWPNPKALRENDAWKAGNAGAWKAMEEAYKAGKVRAIGVSNFMIHHLEALFETAEIKPQVNQILLAPGCAQEEVVAFCREHDMVIEAYSPLGTGNIFGHKEVEEIADRYGKSVAQVALRWSLQKGFLPLPKSVTPKNIEANLEIFDFELSQADMEKLDKLEGIASQSNPDEVQF
ncbi:aldo/keto reductase [Streptococcus acidominimus]|uniref:Aldo/keto reductase n=1 Tax=Streptococcus acidominimus TaxID=1326 RepID=A0A4Y9FMC0_STRAI|nr:aldo/keto reductase [Streptococcus acidominimus]MBF0819594.1 aldo/keto reductase [Streptococcus acidominimus]MBF0839665.1 aldo/keto reductase [Streptococcus acidominimus]MBF0847188.1 aldo/keto reductase [Streptococcus danieliae]TFU29683.1 aldo/keto reductase [Streptococcus acidominimus]